MSENINVPERIVKSIIGNYYGVVEVYKIDGKYYMTLGDFDADYGVEISSDLANAMKEYFSKERDVEEIFL